VEVLHIVVLAVIQGITEFLPISSSGHLILPAILFGWPDQGLAFDVAVHVGSLLAVVIYFRRDIAALIAAWFYPLGVGSGSANQDDDYKLAWFVVLGTVPAGLAGLLFHDFIELHLRSPAVIAATTIFFGLVLALADFRHRKLAPGSALNLRDLTLIMVLIIGLSQALALVPGTSRSGITITAALFLGLSRLEAARFSFLLSIPIIVLSGGYKALSLMELQAVPWAELIMGVSLSAISAYVCIHFFLNFINRIGMMPFVYYRLALGGLLIGLIVMPSV